ncbi:hypothetical protein H6501_02820 [Candidatus Woesearchaeota archaeon]|nr:hypothetical protein [Nanoarchaeota archaeon]MCB9370504.1 hypothetical protein [Candidatus Woesearchaeota archaeon]USN43582.1 MAG: hypothetical protein H6500_04265 [Candidatus Woesearchaeota archaeon]
MDKKIEILGNGSVGDKAKQFQLKALDLSEIGWNIQKKFILAQDFLTELLQGQVLSSDSREPRIKNRQLFQHLSSSLSSSFGNVPLAVRFSGDKDARGTGTYLTNFCTLSNLEQALSEVLGSHSSEEALIFRKLAKAGETFGIIIEPIIGQRLGDVFSPIFSGFGYTSTLRGEGYLSIVPGLGGGVSSSEGEKIFASDLKESKGSLEEYLFGELEKMSSYLSPKKRRLSVLLRNFGSRELGFLGDAFDLKSEEVMKTYFDFEALGLDTFFRTLNLNPLFEMMESTERTFGTPQYFEWAMTLDNEAKAKYWITQIADCDKEVDSLEFEDFGDTLFLAHTVTGTGKKDCSDIICCWNQEDLKKLPTFNNSHSQYILMFSSRLSRLGALHLKDFYNAAVLLELQDANHIGDPISHLVGKVKETGLYFGVLDYEGEIAPRWDIFSGEETIYKGKLGVCASEAKNRLVIYR